MEADVMGQLDREPVPPHAITMWLTDHDIIALLPMKNGGPAYMMKFPLNEGGLMRALELLQQRKHEVLSPTEALDAFDPPKTQPQVRVSKAQERLYAETTPEQRDAAQALLRKLGLVKP
jgi:hypothetical protein